MDASALAETKLQEAATPELIFGLVAPIGVDLDMVSEVLSQELRDMQYASHNLRLTDLMKEIKFESIKDRIAYANEVRDKLGNEALAAMAVSAIRTFRSEKHIELRNSNSSAVGSEADEERPLPSQAYILRQFKRPEEISLLRSIYGRQFILVSAFAPEEMRRRKVETAERKSRGGIISPVEAHCAVHELLAQDAKEDMESHGQNVRDAFPLGDVFIDTSTKAACEETIRRFVRLLFGNNEITPTREEYGMYLAKSASLRSSDLSRQVGAVICRPSGQVLTLGCNEVPKATGGTYWTGDLGDGRDFVRGYDTNDRHKLEVLSDLISRLKEGKFLAATLEEGKAPEQIAQTLLKDDGPRGVGASRLMDIIEFGRIIHAEMCALTDAARLGISVLGSTLVCTTFPCHLCAKHIVASGISRVIFLEPYPKSYASELHDDSISVGARVEGRVAFEPFIGVSPYRYRDLFEKGKRKYSGGVAQPWNKGQRRPMIEVYHPAYFKSETYIVDAFHQKVKAFEETRTT